MAKRPPNMEETPALSPVEEYNEDTEQAIMDAFGAGEHDVKWEIRVYRVIGSNREGNKEPYLFSCDPSELPINDKLRDEYGTGTYRIRVYKNRGLHAAYDLTVEAPSKKTEATPQIKSELSTFAQAIEVMNARQMQFMERVIQKLEERQQPQMPIMPDPFAMLERVAGVISNLGITKGGGADATAMMDIFTKGVEMAANFSGGGKEKGVMDLIGDFVNSPALQTILETMKQQPQAQAQPMGGYGPRPQQRIMQPQIPVPRPQPANAPIVQATSPMAQPIDVTNLPPEQIGKLLKENVDFLVEKAKRNADPGLYSDYILDNVPEAIIEYMLSQPNIIEQLTVLNASVAQYPGWFKQLLVEMNATVQIDGEASDASNGPAKPANIPIQRAGGASGGTGNPQTNEGNGSGI